MNKINCFSNPASKQNKTTTPIMTFLKDIQVQCHIPEIGGRKWGRATVEIKQYQNLSIVLRLVAERLKDLAGH